MEVRSFEQINNCYSNYHDYCEKMEIEVRDECPLCHFKISPNLIGEAVGAMHYVLLECPSCKKLFVEEYITKFSSRSYAGYSCNFKRIFPKMGKEIIVQDNVSAISPMFINIYNQAVKAEVEELDQIAGMGYRKALEFLIKDYLKHKISGEDDGIEKMSLGNCINKIENENIKRMARGAAWLGNDETHYVRKWENKDVTDLKRIISLMLTWIELELKTEEYARDMGL